VITPGYAARAAYAGRMLKKRTRVLFPGAKPGLQTETCKTGKIAKSIMPSDTLIIISKEPE
jgi:hypothetical protein